MKKVAIVDYGLGNIFSIKQALLALDCEVLVTSNAEDLKSADGILLPGVGAFADAMKRLHERDLVSLLKEEAASGKPLLGICLGLQLLFEKSMEFGTHNGLGLIAGTVEKFPEKHNDTALTVPFIGWNKLEVLPAHKLNSMFLDLTDNSKVFFVHSYHVKPANSDHILATTSYYEFAYPAIIQYKNITGIQGHPEKSGKTGLKIYENWLNNL